MRKQKVAPKKTDTTKSKAKTKAKAKPTAEALSDQQRQALLFQHKRKIVPLLEDEKEAKAAVAKAYELAKKEGIPKKEVELAIKLASEDGIEAIKVEVERTHRIARWMGIGKQLDLFGDKETLSQRHFEDGRRAALDDQPAKPPAHLATKDANTWLNGHAAGQKMVNNTRAEGFKPLSDTVGDLMDRAGIAPIANGTSADVDGVVTH